MLHNYVKQLHHNGDDQRLKSTAWPILVNSLMVRVVGVAFAQTIYGDMSCSILLVQNYFLHLSLVVILVLLVPRSPSHFPA